MSNFYAYLSRMKNITRWGLMRNTGRENIAEHSLQVAVFAHALALISNKYFGGEHSPERVATLAVFHDAPEVITGDMATPVKYFNPEITAAYKDMEAIACGKLISLLPEDFREDYTALLEPDEREERSRRLVKAADKLSAYAKCIEEERAGNKEYSMAKRSILQNIHNMKMPEAEYFLEHFIPGFELTLDELNR